MSKSTGNFLTLSDAVEKYSADGSIFLIFINFLISVFQGCVWLLRMLEMELKMQTLLRRWQMRESCVCIIGLIGSGRSVSQRYKDQICWSSSQSILHQIFLVDDTEMNFYDKTFESEMNKAIQITKRNYEAMNFKEALKSGFFELQVSTSRLFFNIFQLFL